jgi:hypothetical protein
VLHLSGPLFNGKEELFVTEDKMDEKTSFDGKKIKVLGPTYEEGKPGAADNWRLKLRSRDEMLAYLKTGERYWFNEEWFGSEKRKTKA